MHEKNKPVCLVGSELRQNLLEKKSLKFTNIHFHKRNALVSSRFEKS